MGGGKLGLRERLHNSAGAGLLNCLLRVVDPAMSLESLRRRFT